MGRCSTRVSRTYQQPRPYSPATGASISPHPSTTPRTPHTTSTPHLPPSGTPPIPVSAHYIHTRHTDPNPRTHPADLHVPTPFPSTDSHLYASVTGSRFTGFDTNSSRTVPGSTHGIPLSLPLRISRIATLRHGIGSTEIPCTNTHIRAHSRIRLKIRHQIFSNPLFRLCTPLVFGILHTRVSRSSRKDVRNTVGVTEHRSNQTGIRSHTGNRIRLR